MKFKSNFNPARVQHLVSIQYCPLHHSLKAHDWVSTLSTLFRQAAATAFLASKNKKPKKGKTSKGAEGKGKEKKKK